jgi:hypothetical protein
MKAVLLASGELVMANDSLMGRVRPSIVLTDAQVAHATHEVSDGASVSCFMERLTNAENFMSQCSRC